MMRYLVYLLAYIPVQIFAYLITPLLPLFEVWRFGGIDNARYQGTGLRLPLWLAWFDTPDNTLRGDDNWLRAHQKMTYWNKVCWLYRNSLYGFKWSVLACPMKLTTLYQSKGNLTIDYHKEIYGSFTIRLDPYWQYKTVKKLPFNKIFTGNFGWLLDDKSQKKALFMFSPRIKNRA